VGNFPLVPLCTPLTAACSENKIGREQGRLVEEKNQLWRVCFIIKTSKKMGRKKAKVE